MLSWWWWCVVFVFVVFLCFFFFFCFSLFSFCRLLSGQRQTTPRTHKDSAVVPLSTRFRRKFGVLRENLVGLGFFLVSFLYETNPNPRKKNICCGKKWPKCHMFLAFFSWGRFHSNSYLVLRSICCPTHRNLVHRQDPIALRERFVLIVCNLNACYIPVLIHTCCKLCGRHLPVWYAAET